eukprot:6208669-Pleurochrysis_carterae.AAC.1
MSCVREARIPMVVSLYRYWPSASKYNLASSGLYEHARHAIRILIQRLHAVAALGPRGFNRPKRRADGISILKLTAGQA